MIMEAGFYTLQDFMAYTKLVVYLIMVAILFGITGFWLFLSERDSDQGSEEHQNKVQHH